MLAWPGSCTNHHQTLRIESYHDTSARFEPFIMTKMQIQSAHGSAAANEGDAQIGIELSRKNDGDNANIVGNIEHYEHGRLSGWIQNTTKPEHRVSISVFENNRIVATTVADIYRDDLKNAGVGDGKCGFMATLDESILDGNIHELTVIDKDSAIELGSFELTTAVFSFSEIAEIHLGCINGSISLRDPNDANGFDIEILADGELCATGVCELNKVSGSYVFSVQLPSSLFDDCYHIYSARLKGLVTQYRTFQEKLPSIITPWQYLSDNIASGSLSSLSKISGYRYNSLQSHLRSKTSLNFTNTMLAHDIVVEGYLNRKRFPKLTLAVASNPQVSIVIPVHNKFELTYHCIASLILAYNDASFEVIVVDDMSSDSTTDIEQFVDNVKVVRNKTNLGFLLGSCAGAEKASAKHIVFLNNDTEVTSGWIDNMLNVFNTFSSVGLVGSKLIYPSGKLQEAGGVIWANGKPWNVGNQQNAEDPQFNYARQVDYLSGAAVMINADLWKDVGGFSRDFVPAYYEDVDLAFKVREKGYRTYYCPQSLVIHFEGMSNGRELNFGIKKFQSINAPKFRSKWRHSYRDNGIEGQDLRRQMDRNIDFRVLMVDSAVPRPDQDAGGYAATQEIALMQELGCKVTFIPNNMAHMGAYTATLQAKGVECIYAPFYNNIGEFLQQHGSEFDLVYVIRYDVAEDIIQYIKQYSSAKIVLNNCDLHFLRELRAALSTDEKCIDGALETRDRELDIMRNVDAVLSYNEVEHSVIASHNLTVDNIYKCPWVLESKLSSVPFEDREGIAFLGGFNHTPNKEAIKYFVSTVMPLLRIAMPGIKLHVYGSNVTEEIEKLACNDVVVEGYVKSLSTVFDSCRVFIAPLLSGAGIKGKVLESIAYGVPCVLSAVAAESTGLTHGTNTLIAKTGEQWVQYISSLYNDKNRWNDMSVSCNSLVESQYSFENGLAEMADLFKFLELDPATNRPALLRR